MMQSLGDDNNRVSSSSLLYLVHVAQGSALIDVLCTHDFVCVRLLLHDPIFLYIFKYFFIVSTV
jgi:hypothetical protein